MGEAATPLEAGQQVDGLQIEKELGRGAYGIVYLARDVLLGRQVALKVLPGGEGDVDQTQRDEALTEARLIANLNSPHVVTLYRLRATDDGGWMLEMEYVDGGSLEGEVATGRPLPLARAIEIFRGVCRALKAAHAARIIHGDIKPANVMFDRDGEIKLADFGLGCMLEGSAASIELHGRIFGTPTYMAPEVMSGEEAGMASDLWAAGALFHQLLSGKLPFVANDFVQLWTKVLDSDPEPLPPEVPEPLAELVGTCLAKQPADRARSAGWLLEELDRLAALDTRLAPAAAARANPTNLPAATTSFVGRGADLAVVGELLSDETVRVVTLMGPGGIGKTRLSQQLCRDLLDRFEGGCWFADLSEIHDAVGIAHTVARALGVPIGGDKDPVDQVGGILQFRKPMLCVLDNFEQLVGHAAATVGRWLSEAPAVRFLVTSRALLGLGGERPHELSPLATPMGEFDPAKAIEYAGVQLFAERAREINPAFEVTDENAKDVARICRELDGMPLAIELAAARARIMRPAQIAGKLEKKFQLLRSTRTDLTPRQKTLAGAIDWSYDLLDEVERSAFLQACAFSGGFFLDAAEEVIDLSRFEDAPFAMDLVQSLREKSLLTAYDAGQETRLGMYAAIREYGLQKWESTATPEQRAALGDRHTSYFLTMGEELNARIPGPRDQEALDRIEIEVANLRAVFRRALDAGESGTAVRAALALAETMRIRSAPREYIPMLESVAGITRDRDSKALIETHLANALMVSGDWDRALELADAAAEIDAAPHAQGRALLVQADLRRHRGNLDGAQESFEACVSIAEGTNDEPVLAVAIGGRGTILWQRGEFDGAEACWAQAEEIAERIGDDSTRIRFKGNRGIYRQERGDLPEAISFMEEAENLARKLGDRHWTAWSLSNRASLLLRSGDMETSLECYREAEKVARDLGDRAQISEIAGNIGTLHSLRGALDAALERYREAESIARELGSRRRIAITVQQRAGVHVKREDFQTALECYREAESIGSEIGDRQVIAFNRCQQGAVLRSLIRLDDADEILRQGLAMYDEIGADRSAEYFQFKTVYTLLTAERGGRDAARTLAVETLELADHLGLKEDHPAPSIRAGLVDLRKLLSG